MKSLMTKASNAASSLALLVFGGVLAGLGLAMMGVLALFAFAALGVALIAAPFMALSQTSDAEEQPGEAAAA